MLNNMELLFVELMLKLMPSNNSSLKRIMLSPNNSLEILIKLKIE